MSPKRILAAAVVFAALVVPASAQILPTINPAALQVQSNHYCADVDGDSSAPGAAVVQVPCCVGCTRSQKWSFVDPTPGQSWVLLKNGNSNLCMMVFSQVDGDTVYQATCDTNPQQHSQRWAIVSTSFNGQYRFQNVHSGLCLAMQPGRYQTGLPLIQTACQVGALNQVFELNHPPLCAQA